jgi:hypothetical protein
MRTTLAAAFAVLLTVPAFAADEDKAFKSGPKPGDSVPGPFQPYVVVGKAKFKGKIHCPVTESGLNPVVAVFVRSTEATETVTKLVQQLDEAAVKNELARLGAFVVFLDNDIKEDEREADKNKAAVDRVLKEDDEREKVAGALEDRFKELKQTSVLHDWVGNVKSLFKLHDDAEVTVVVYNQNKVLSTHAFRRGELTDAGVKAVLEDVAARIKAIRDELAGRPKP